MLFVLWLWSVKCGESVSGLDSGARRLRASQHDNQIALSSFIQVTQAVHNIYDAQEINISRPAPCDILLLG